MTSSRSGGPTACSTRIAPTPFGAGSPSRSRSTRRSGVRSE